MTSSRGKGESTMKAVSEYLLPFEAGRKFDPPVSGQRVSQLVDSGVLEAIRTPSGRRLVSARSVARLIAERAKQQAERIPHATDSEDSAR